MRTSATEASAPLHIRRYEFSDKRAVRRLHDDALNEVGAHRGSGPGDEDLHLDTTVQQLAAQHLYLKNGYRGAGRSSVRPFDCIFYEESIG
ncbi:MAG: hypothetical protein M3317_11730 [Actinomycetota bacterium]|nr:hypothetical protein [Actinomycetota bacterium]